MSSFSGIEDAKVQQGGVYLLQGTYDLIINSVKVGRSRKGEEFFAVDFEIETSSNPERTPGSTVSWMTMRRFDGYLPAVKGFILAAMDAADGDVTAAVCDAAVSVDQPLAGQRVKAQAVDIITRAGKPFTKIQFFASKIPF